MVISRMLIHTYTIRLAEIRTLHASRRFANRYARTANGVPITWTI